MFRKLYNIAQDIFFTYAAYLACKGVALFVRDLANSFRKDPKHW